MEESDFLFFVGVSNIDDLLFVNEVEFSIS